MEARPIVPGVHAALDTDRAAVELFLLEALELVAELVAALAATPHQQKNERKSFCHAS